MSTVTENDRKYICKRGNLFEDIYFAREFMIMLNERRERERERQTDRRTDREEVTT